MMSVDQLAGLLQVRPGVARPATLTGTRPDWAAQLSRGRPASALPDLLGTVFSLCGQAHRLCAQAAVDAALGRDAASAHAAGTLRDETLREHLRRILLDWPALPGTGNTDEAAAALRTCPAFRPGGDAADLVRWIERDLLGEAAPAWLTAHERAPAAAWADWCARSTGWLAGLMRALRHDADRPLAAFAAAPLRAHADERGLRALAAALREQPGYTRRPQIDGACAETGSWTRLNDEAAMPASAWLRCGARLAELVRLALPDASARSGRQWLRSGRLAPAPGEGVAWVEMARGVLVHHVVLDGRSTTARIEACHVLAPTEWNFHSDGPVARALEALPPAGSPGCERQVAALMAAYDPCVRYELPDTTQRHEEVFHA